MGYDYEIRLLRGTTEIVWSICVKGSYRDIRGKTHPFNVMSKSLKYGDLLYKDLRTEIERILPKVREVRDSDRWEETERILAEMLQFLVKEPDLHMSFIDTTDWKDLEEQMADETL